MYSKGLPGGSGSGSRPLRLDEIRASLARWHANEGENPVSFDNLYSVEDQPSLLICCSRFSNKNKKTGSIAEWVLAERHPASREVLLKKLMPPLKPKTIVDLIGTGLRLRRTWCYSGSTATIEKAGENGKKTKTQTKTR